MKTSALNKAMYSVFIWMLLLPGTAMAAQDRGGEDFNFRPVTRVIGFLADWALLVAGPLIILSFAYSALLFTIAGSSQEMVKRGRKQFIVTCVTTGIIGGYFLIKNVILEFALGGFG